MIVIFSLESLSSVIVDVYTGNDKDEFGYKESTTEIGKLSVGVNKNYHLFILVEPHRNPGSVEIKVTGIDDR